MMDQTKEAIKEAGATAAKEARQEAKRFKQEAEEKIKDAHEHIDLSGYAEKAGEQVRRIVDEVQEETGELQEHLRNEIKANPMRSGLIALGVGFLLGMLVGRR